MVSADSLLFIVKLTSPLEESRLWTVEVFGVLLIPFFCGFTITASMSLSARLGRGVLLFFSVARKKGNQKKAPFKGTFPLKILLAGFWF